MTTPHRSYPGPSLAPQGGPGGPQATAEGQAQGAPSQAPCVGRPAAKACR